jgi:altronate dehydratase large subunit
MADRIVDAGGQAMIGETLEWMGAEHLLAVRARTPEIAVALREAVRAREGLAIAVGVDLMGNNPGPTNIASGLSSIEEKALGNIAKSGSRTFQGVIGYGEPPLGPGLWAMDGAAYSPESLTGFVAAGAQLLLFTTGVGNSYVSALAPTIKISANPTSGRVLKEQLDFDASIAFLGRAELRTMGEALFEDILAIASGQATWGEILGEGDEVISRFGPAL